jgi:hypothetical protein
MEGEEEKRPVGRPKNIESPEQLWKLFRQYRKHAKDNPYLKQDFVGKDADEVERRLERPLTFVGFEVYLMERMIINDLADYERNKDGRYAEFANIIRAIKKIIEADQFEGAAVGVYKENIIARKLGLADKQEARQVDKNGNDIPQSPQILVIAPGTPEYDEFEIKETED